MPRGQTFWFFLFYVLRLPPPKLGGYLSYLCMQSFVTNFAITIYVVQRRSLADWRLSHTTYSLDLNLVYSWHKTDSNMNNLVCFSLPVTSTRCNYYSNQYCTLHIIDFVHVLHLLFSTYTQGCHGHGKVMEFLEFWNFFGISGKVMEFWLKLGRIMEKSWNFEIVAKSHRKVMAFDKEILNSHESAPLRCSLFKFQPICMSDKRSWNFMIRSRKSHGILSKWFRGNPVYMYMTIAYRYARAYLENIRT